MSQRNEGKFKQREVTRTIKAIEAAGRVVDHVEITKDGARITVRQDAKPKESAANEWDQVLDETPLPLRS